MANRRQQLVVLLNNGGVSPAEAYDNAVLAQSPIAYWKLNEGSGSVITDSSGNAYTGTYTGITWDGTQYLSEPVPLWDAVNDYGNLYSASFATALNMNEFTIMGWYKMSSAGVWTDSTQRKLLYIVRDPGNLIEFTKLSINNFLSLRRVGGSTSKQTDSTIVGGSTDWFSVALSCSVAGGGLLAAGDLKGYVNGTQIETTKTGNIASTGSGLSSTQVLLGARSLTPTEVHSGYASRLAIWNRPIDADILALMTV